MALSTRQYNAVLFVLVLAVLLLTIRPVGEPVRPGLDASWVYAYNSFGSQDLRVGRDVVSSYGPLGFLACTMPLGSNIAVAQAFEVLVRLALTLVFFRLFLGAVPEKRGGTVLRAALLLLLLFSTGRGYYSTGIELVALTSAMILLAYTERRPSWATASLAVVAPAFLIKFSTGLLCLTFLAVHALWEAASLRNIRTPLMRAGALALLVPALWLALYGDLQGVGDYLISAIEQSRGYASAMTSLGSPDVPFWSFAAIGATLVLLFLAVRGDPSTAFLFLLYLPGLLIALKYGVTKQPRFLFSYAFLFLLFLTSRARPLLRQAAVASLMLLFLFIMNRAIDPGSFSVGAAAQLFEPVDLRSSLGQVIDPGGYTKALRKESEALLEPSRLSDETHAMLGTSSVDTYPWEISFIPANGLNWRPRPAFQSYFAYTPWFDGRNEAFFRSPQAPVYLLWDAERADSMESIDGRYLLNDEPLTITQVLGRYDFVREDGNAVVFRRRDVPKFREPFVIGQTDTLTWNEGFRVPFKKGGILRARLQFTRTLLGRVRRAVYKESPIFVEYLLDSDEVVHTRLVIDNAVSGIWVNPFVVSLLRPNSAARVIAMRIMNPDAEKGAFSPQFSVQWELIGFNGSPDPHFRLRDPS
jgi:hypothetical protein